MGALSLKPRERSTSPGPSRPNGLLQCLTQRRALPRSPTATKQVPSALNQRLRSKCSFRGCQVPDLTRICRNPVAADYRSPAGDRGDLRVKGTVGTALQVCPPASDRASARSLRVERREILRHPFASLRAQAQNDTKRRARHDIPEYRFSKVNR